MFLVGSKDIGPLKYILSYIEKKNKKHFLIIKTKKNDHYTRGFKTIVQWKKIKPKLVITGTCIGSGLDKNLVKFAKKKKIPCISLVEHWSFLAERFYEKNFLLLPDYIGVVDISCKNFYAKEFNYPEKKILILNNNYLSKLKIIHKKNLEKKTKKILFVSQPHKKLEKKLNKLFGIKKFFGFNEYKVVKKLISNLDENYEITIKLHPNEPLSKYNLLNIKNKIKFLKNNFPNSKIVRNFDIIIGMDSMLLLELSIMGAKVIAFRPDANNSFYGNKLKKFPIMNNIPDLTKMIKNFKFKIKKRLNFKTKRIFPILERIKND